MILTPIGFANLTDGRGRFREIYCAIRSDHGRGLPEDLPCDDAIVRLPGEPQVTGRPVNLTSLPRPLRVVVVPGIFDECIRKYVQTYSDALAHFETHGWRTGTVPVSGRSATIHLDQGDGMRRAVVQINEPGLEAGTEAPARVRQYRISARGPARRRRDADGDRAGRRHARGWRRDGRRLSDSDLLRGSTAPQAESRGEQGERARQTYW